MKKNIFFTIIGLLFFISLNLCSAQVLIRPTSLNNPFFKLEQLFKIQLINTTNESVQGILQVRLEDNFSKAILQIHSLPIELKKGQSVNATQIDWEAGFDLANQQIAGILSQNGRLPNGQYIYCYRFVDRTSGRTLGSHCQESGLFNYQLPSLIYPQDNQTISTPFPVLSWRPPMPLFGNELNYALRLVALEEGQSPLDAIHSNIPFIEKYRLKGLAMTYPITAIPLEEGQRYAWQVIAFWNETEIGKTEVWEFTLKETIPVESKIKQESYRLVKRQMGASLYVFSKNIYFAYQNQFYEPILNYRIYPKDNPEEALVDLPAINLTPGINEIDLEINKKIKLEKNRSYVLEIKDKGGAKYFMGFKYVKE